MNIKDLLVTQNGFRHPTQLDEMTEFVKDNGKFDEKSLSKHHKSINSDYDTRIITIDRFEDGQLFIADGHHRILAINKAGREFLHKEEYHIVDWTYDEYTDINLDCGWVTPFDPRNEYRLCDLGGWKDLVETTSSIYDENPEIVEKFINTNGFLFKEERCCNDIISLAKLNNLL